MASTLMKGSVTLADGSTHDWTAGPRERIKAERALGIKPSAITEGGIGEEYIAFLVWASLERQGITLGTFEEFLDTLEDYEVSPNPESEAPPAS